LIFIVFVFALAERKNEKPGALWANQEVPCCRRQKGFDDGDHVSPIDCSFLNCMSKVWRVLCDMLNRLLGII
jgi:hypothetical protein